MDASKARPKRGLGGNILLFFISLLLALVLAELLLRLFISLPQKHFVWPRGTQIEFRPEIGRMPGVYGVSQLSIDQQGFRGIPPAENPDYTILCLGGSTTECAYLDDSETWPQVLQAQLNARADGRTYRVLNGGRSGLSMRHHVLQMELLLAEIPDIDAVVFLVGINDLLHHLNQGIPQASEAEILKEAFLEVPLEDPPFLNSRILLLWDRATAPEPEVKESLIQDHVGIVFDKWRVHRYRSVLDSNFVNAPVPPEYLQLKGLDRVAQLGDQHGVDVLFLTQPVMWHPDLITNFRRLLWMGGTGDYQTHPGAAYYRVETLARCMHRMNQNLVAACQQRGLPVYDIAATLPADTSIFYDDCHFNEGGARAMGVQIAEFWNSNLGPEQ